MTPKPKLEGDVKAELLAALAPLEALGRIIVIRQQAGTRSGGRMRLGKPGTPDLQVLVAGGRTLFIELKRSGNKSGKKSSNPKTIAAQAAWRERAAKLGHDVQVCDDAAHAKALVIAALMGVPGSTERAGKAP